MRKWLRDRCWLLGFECYLYKLGFVRRFFGGHWERWWIDVPVTAYVWMPVDECSVGKERPCGLCRGTPTCEPPPLLERLAKL